MSAAPFARIRTRTLAAPVMANAFVLALVAISYDIQAADDNPSLEKLSVYAIGGGVFFLIQAGLLAWRSVRRGPSV